MIFGLRLAIVAGLTCGLAMTACNSGKNSTSESAKNEKDNFRSKRRDPAKAPSSDLDRLSQLGKSMRRFDLEYGFLPIGGLDNKGILIINPDQKPTLSWRVALLEYIDENELYKEFKLDEPWDSEHNKKLIEQMPELYVSKRHPNTPAGQTHFQQIRGPKFLKPIAPIALIRDGAESTLVIVEAANPVIWTKPDDLEIIDLEMPKSLKSKLGGHPDGFFGITGIGQGLFFDFKKYDDATIWKLLVPDDGGKVQFVD
ncbi:MAG: DUF1559 domain-containing protein [Planctomycetes bacterium]|nr:DUF1559 domain-containing protein [Planctomycetota bacterium]